MAGPSTTALLHFREMATATAAFGKRTSVKYRLMGPEKAKPDAKHCLILFLHGAGERGSDNEKQLLYLPDVLARPDNRTRYACYAIAPQCPNGMRWVEVPWDATDTTPHGEPSPAMKMVTDILEEVLHTWPIDETRIYLTGMSMGGYGVWDLAMRRPKQFAALAPLCGGGDEAKADVLKNLPIWAVHGEIDTAVPVVRSRRMIEAIKAAGGEPKYSELPGVAHNCWTRAYSPEFGLLDWLFAQRLKS